MAVPACVGAPRASESPAAARSASVSLPRPMLLALPIRGSGWKVMPCSVRAAGAGAGAGAGAARIAAAGGSFPGPGPGRGARPHVAADERSCAVGACSLAGEDRSAGPG